MACAYAMVPSAPWFVGFITLLHSLAHNTDAADDRCGYAFVGHPSLNDTHLTRAQLGMVRATSRGRREHWHTVDTRRLSRWQAVPHLRKGAIMALIKLELFYDAGASPCAPQRTPAPRDDATRRCDELGVRVCVR